MQKSVKTADQKIPKKIEPGDENKVTDANSVNMFGFQNLDKSLKI